MTRKLSALLVAMFLCWHPGYAQTWSNQSLTGGLETLAFSATPTVSGAAAKEVIIGLSSASATKFAALAVAVRFSANSVIDARNGNTYAAVSPVQYKAGVAYEFQLTLNIPAHTYSATVRPAGGTAITIATNYKFRTEQATAKELSNLVIYSGKGGGVAVTNAALSTPITPFTLPGKAKP